ncbi:MAG: helix-turn-helix domain-containing protein [Chloroflexota bacterium]|nr:helix-turn-helix domain-containing protein [Chloroflexota bacterium]
MDDLERFEYMDEGCELFPSCLRCPLPRCRYDDPSGLQVARDERNQEIVRRHRSEGLSAEALAALFGVSKRTAYRAIAAARREPVAASKKEEP